MHQFLKFIFGIKLYMFRAVPLSIIRSFSLYTQQWYMSYRFADSLIRTELVPSWSCCKLSAQLSVMLYFKINTLYARSSWVLITERDRIAYKPFRENSCLLLTNVCNSVVSSQRCVRWLDLIICACRTVVKIRYSSLVMAATCRIVQ